MKLLNSHKVEYLLIGGFAVGYHGYPRATGDMDIWIAVSPENADKMINLLKEFGFDVPGLTADLFMKKRQVVRMGVPPIRIEVLTDISGVSFDECYKNKVTGFIDGIRVNIISAADRRCYYEQRTHCSGNPVSDCQSSGKTARNA
ncbi:MAG: hypothetical protein GY795_03780 [Desulfobacterales bacterium]|nr:hypothetical protein [Desulfobacterales bacterium]